MASSVLPHLRRRRFPVPRLLSAQRSSPCCTATPPASAADGGEKGGAAGRRGRWLTLSPFAPQVDVASIGKEIVRGRRPSEPRCSPTTALKWVRRCCPSLPVSLVHKLFRLRQVRREAMSISTAACLETQAPHRLLKRVSGREPMKSGDVIFLPITVQEYFQDKADYCFNEDEMNYFRSLAFYKDEAILAVNKPPGMPVQGGVGIKLSMDSLAGSYLRYDYPEPPRLVHRLDKESSGILVLGRTQASTSILHSIFRAKTYGAFDEIGNNQGIFKKKYWALVIGNPRRPKGLITSPLRKVVLEDGKSERIMVANSEGDTSSQCAVTEYKVIGSTYGLTWLELCPLTGRKHQLRVHCSEVLGTPIVGDFKYGWSGHRKWQPLASPNPTKVIEKACTLGSPFGLDLEGGSVLDQKPSLHLHCRQMILPDISVVLQQLQPSSLSHDFSKLKGLELVAPLPSHMQKSWDVLNSAQILKSSDITLPE